VVLPDDRVIVGDFQCLDKQGNLILGNAHEVIAHAAAAASGGGNGGGGGKPGGSKGGGGDKEGAAGGMQKPLGMVLVPRAQQKDVQLMVTLSERAAMLELAGS
jgi:small nuclear ribonucleoprotein (snRNP)-like protein